MAKLVFSEAFIEDMLAVELANKRDEILEKVDLLSSFPELGSGNVPASIRAKYGDSIHKLVVSPFDVIYDHDLDSDTVNVLGLIHQRTAR